MTYSKEKRRARYLKNKDRESVTMKEYQDSHKNEISCYSKQWRETNKKKLKIKRQQYREKNQEKIRLGNKSYYLKNKKSLIKKQKEYVKKKYKNDIVYRLKSNMRTRISCALNGKIKKTYRTIELLGCSIDFLKKYLESKFKPGMTWGNRRSEWHIDHIRPCVSFDLTDINQQKECFHYSNLQPLWAQENLSKGRQILFSPMQRGGFGNCCSDRAKESILESHQL